MRSLSMLFYVVECFTVNLEKLAADAIGSLNLNRINEYIKGQGRLISEAFGKTDHEVDQVSALDTHRAHVRNHAAELRRLAFDGLLQVREAPGGLLGACGDLFAKDVELNLEAEQGLENAVVEVARDAATFGLDGAGAQVAEQKDVLERRADVTRDAFKPG